MDPAELNKEKYKNKGIKKMSEETKEVKNTTEVTKEVSKDTAVTTTTKKTTWWNRVVSAVVGAVVAVGAMFGITGNQVAAEKAKVESVKTQAIAALDALKAGDVTTATAKLQEAIATGKEVVNDVKAAAEQVKNADKNSVVETAKNAVTETLVKDQVKKVETAVATYSAGTPEVKATKTAEVKAVKVEEKKTEVKAATPAKK